MLPVLLQQLPKQVRIPAVQCIHYKKKDKNMLCTVLTAMVRILSTISTLPPMKLHIARPGLGPKTAPATAAMNPQRLERCNIANNYC